MHFDAKQPKQPLQIACGFCNLKVNQAINTSAFPDHADTLYLICCRSSLCRSVVSVFENNRPCQAFEKEELLRFLCTEVMAFLRMEDWTAEQNFGSNSFCRSLKERLHVLAQTAGRGLRSPRTARDNSVRCFTTHCDHDEVNRSPDTGRNAVIGPTRMRLDALWNCRC